MNKTDSRRRNGALVLSVLAASFFWAGWLVNLVSQTQINAVVGAVAISAPILLMLGPSRPAFLDLARILLILFPVSVLSIEVLTASSAQNLFGGWRLWPLLLATCAATLSASLLRVDHIRTTAIGLSVFILLFLGGLFTMLEEAAIVDRWVLRSPVHFFIIMIALTIFVLQSLAVARGAFPRSEATFVGGLIQLLPLLGFAGTILGIMAALTALPDVFNTDQASENNSEALEALLGGLARAFETTLLGLLGSIAASFVNTFVAVSEPS